MATVVELKNPKFTEQKEAMDFLCKALASHPFVDAKKAMSVEHVQALIESPNFGIFLGVEKGQFAGVVMVSLPNSPFMVLPQIFHFVNNGSLELRNMLVKAMVDFITGNGYTKYWAINVTGKSDEAYARVFRKAGLENRIGSVMEFTVT